MQNVYDQLVVNEINTNTGIYVLGGMYTLNLIDILLEKQFTNFSGFSNNSIKNDVKVGITPNGPGIKIGIQLED